MELALAIARIADNEKPFVRLLRGLRQDLGTTAAQAIQPLRRTLASDDAVPHLTKDIIDQCAMNFARNQHEAGSEALAQIIYHLLPVHDDPIECQILKSCAARLSTIGVSRLEYLVLALLILQRPERT